MLYLKNSLLFISIILLTQCSQKTSNFDITDYGAVPGRETLNTAAIQNAVDACSAMGGGKVLIPPGTYYSGSILLKDNVELHLQAGAKLLASEDINDYETIKVDYISQNRDYGGHGLYPEDERFAFILAYKATNIAITGEGIIDGNGGNGKSFQVTVDSADNWHKPRRPRLVHLISCKDILIRDVDMQYCQNWNLHLENCEDINIDNITILGHANANDDGIDINSCRDVTIQNCKVDVGDDGLVFKTKGKKQQREHPGTELYFCQ